MQNRIQRQVYPRWRGEHSSNGWPSASVSWFIPAGAGNTVS
ncbi:hypothetical protein A464_2958 [Salmonella bongori N268-08]|uniref:Uncharacterized protein n=1 Tax=Salmonella bongori N268-08 TaxID=1197719 RepID=S5NIM4_SALBN|nr:hypothetical protein A464_2958 [Salmonella bongori N268-08]